MKSLERGLAVLTTFSAEQPRLTNSQVAKLTGLTRASARRFLLTLEQLGYLRQRGDTFSLTPKVLDVAYAYVSSLNLAEIAQPHMENLVRVTQESSSIATLDGTEIVYAVRVPTSRIMTVALTVGSRLPAYATSMGRVLLSALPPVELDEYFRQAELRALTTRTVTNEAKLREILTQVREQGWAMTDQELEEGVRSIAAPLRDERRDFVAALNVSTHAGRVSKTHLLRTLLPQLLETARRITHDLTASTPAGHRPTWTPVESTRPD